LTLYIDIYIINIEKKRGADTQGETNMIDTRKAHKVTKREIYAKYGIEYKDGKIMSPLGLVRELLKVGNDKTGKLVLTFSTCPGRGTYTAVVNGFEITVKGTCVCECVGCYAMTGHYHRKTVKKSMVINTWLVNNALDFVRRALSAQIEYAGRGEVRIHAAGDFNTTDSDAYANTWHDIAAAFRAFRFWTYTKIKKYETLFDDLKNANVVKSLIPNVGKNYGHCGYIIDTYYALKALDKSVYICRCGVDKAQHCERCGVCATYEYVLFIEHSTEYKAELDPLYPKLCEIANNQ